MLMNEWDGDCTPSCLQAAGGEKYIATIHLDTSNCLREGEGEEEKASAYMMALSKASWVLFRRPQRPLKSNHSNRNAEM